jgi:hypothetical protein
MFITSKEAKRIKLSLTMDSLPNEILTIIFQYIRVEKLKNCTLVCKRWNDVISRSREFLKRAELRLDSNTEYNLENIRKYKNIRFQSDCHGIISLITNEIIQQVKDSCSINLKSIVICGKNKTSLKGFLDFLQSCQVLEDLRIYNLNRLEDSAEAITPIQLPTIKKMTNYESFWILDYFDVSCNKFEKLEIKLGPLRPWEVPRVRREELVEFNKIITFLNTVQSCRVLSFFNLDLNYEYTLVPKFKWQELKLFNTGSSDNIMNFKQILHSSEKDAIIKIDSSAYPNLLNKSLKNILNEVAECKNITSLNMCVHSLKDPVKEADFYVGLKTLNHITNLTLEISWEYCLLAADDRCGRFSHIFPNVNELFLSRSNRFLDKKFNYDFSTVKHLKIHLLQEKFEEIGDFNFLGLESLEIIRFALIDLSRMIMFDNLKRIKIHLTYINGDFKDEMERLFKGINSVLPCIEEYEFVDKQKFVHKRSRNELVKNI